MLDTLKCQDPCSSELPRAAWGCGRLFLSVHWAGSEGGSVGGRRRLCVGSPPFSQRGSGTLGENGGMLAHVGVFVSPQRLLGWL